MDATLRGYPLSEVTLWAAMLEVCAIPLDDEVTLTFDQLLPIREADEFGGYRVALIARFEAITTPLKIDITTGDIINPSCYLEMNIDKNP
jgi:hypothetical protein